MPPSKPSTKEKNAAARAKQFAFSEAKLADELRQQALLFEQRYDEVIAKFYRERAKHEQFQRECAQLQRDQQQLQNLLNDKQAVITHLLPSYPQALTPALQRQIDAVFAPDSPAPASGQLAA